MSVSSNSASSPRGVGEGSDGVGDGYSNGDVNGDAPALPSQRNPACVTSTLRGRAKSARTLAPAPSLRGTLSPNAEPPWSGTESSDSGIVVYTGKLARYSLQEDTPGQDPQITA